MHIHSVVGKFEQSNKKKAGLWKEKEVQLMQVKVKEVEEKLKKGKKLTTKDLLVFQQKE